MVDNLFLENIVKNRKEFKNLSLDEISDILNKAKVIFEKEPLLINLNGIEQDEEIYVIGDIHGNLETLNKILDLIEENKIKRVIFLGDIVDRGEKQLECFILIMSLKILEPERFFILRGNHESLEMNRMYGFLTSFLKRFEDTTKFMEFVVLFNVLPFCLIVNKSILCLHGGIPMESRIINQLKGLKHKDIDELVLNNIESGLFQILWNDPTENSKCFAENFRGPGTFTFGEDAFNEFMEYNNLKFLIRSHECFPEGYRWFFDNRLLSIFSAANYGGPSMPNPATFAIIKNNTISFKILK